MQRRTDARKQTFLGDWLAQKAHRASAQSALANSFIRESCNKDDRDATARFSQAILKLKPGHAAQLYVP